MFASTPKPYNPVVTLRTSDNDTALAVGTLSVSVPKTKGAAVEVVLELKGQKPQFLVVSRAGWLRMMAEANKAATQDKRHA